ncbi:conserved Mce associated membrane protein [Mycobacteroides abscessus subsp. bolletii]|uniref:Mce protein n=1 Tax=Mycobacteroides abscessus TaxID=36809 RepID=UPI0009D133D7|nr:Mce protein [Mycobacteroides abscessus]SKG72452.1 conserved Mce associated membrane protein [Mycobacteroides abscessus subsp. bolletii]SKH10376.1 conserved Mce associated membrane protein [Mycobacteroides abscessus subsp. bolletii]
MTTHTTRRHVPPAISDAEHTDPNPTEAPAHQSLTVDDTPDSAGQPDGQAGEFNDESAAETSPDADGGLATAQTGSPRRWRPSIRRWSISAHRGAQMFSLIALVAVGGLVGWLGTQLYHRHAADQQYAVYLQTARQGALNLTTIDWQHADADVHRILDSAAGRFHDDFSARAKDFTDVVKQTQSHTEGTIVDAGIESESPTGAQVLVAVNVKSTQAGQPEQRSRGWRMRLHVERVADTTKITDVEFVP